MQWRTILLASACCVVATSVATAQQAIDQGSAGGRVTDQSGAVIAGAIAEARHLDTNRTQTATTDDDGRFRFPYLPVGVHDVVVRHPGFAEQRQARQRARHLRDPPELDVGQRATRPGRVHVDPGREADHPIRDLVG